jgi:hypothetical protein
MFMGNVERIDELLDAVELILEDDLEDPELEAMARRCLQELKKEGHDFIDPDEDDGCTACLHMSLLSALGGVETGYFSNEDLDPDLDQPE